jgi:conjugal transfer ATP-binding protein TraC
MWKGDLKNNRLSQEEYAILSKALSFYYKGLGGKDIPTLRGFCKWLPGYVGNNKLIASLFKVETFLLILEPFIEGKYKEHFNSFEELNVEDSKLICFELQAVQGNEKLYPLVVKVLFESVLELVAKQPDQKKFIDIEEGWTMLDDSSSKYIESFFRRGRKENISIRIITQEITEIKNSPVAAAMKGTSTAILLYNEKESVRKEIADFLGIDDFGQEKYASLMRKAGYRGGFREVFIKEMDQTTLWRMELSLFEHAILTSRPDERSAINKFIKELADVELAACQWVKQTLEKEQKYE